MILTISEILAENDLLNSPNEFFELHGLSLSDRFKTIKKAWDIYLPYFEKQYFSKGDLRIDPYFCEWIFSPIEQLVWNDIRCFGTPLFPQFPACGYFLDFANPSLKIAVECDGSAYHDSIKDAKRDANLENDGWIVFRISGKECYKTMQEPEYWVDEDIKQKYQDDWLNTTSEGIIYSIKQFFFSGDEKPLFERFDDDKVREMFRTLDSHCTTKNEFNKRAELIF